MKVRLTTLFLLAIATVGSTGAGSGRQVGTLTVTTLNCVQDLAGTPTLSYLRMNDRSLGHGLLHGPMGLDRESGADGVKLAPGVYRFVLRLAAGNYEIYLRSGRCFGGQVMAIVLPGKERSVSMVAGDAWTMLFDHDHSGVAGTIAKVNTKLALLNADDPDDSRFVDVEDGAFYADSLQRSRWLLRAWADCCAYADFPIDLSGVRPGEYVTVALSPSDVRKRLGYRGPLFSSPSFVAATSGGVWYTNVGRDSVGILESTGLRKEFALARGRSPQLIVADDGDGAWFSEGGGFVGHADAVGNVTELKLGTANEQPRIIRFVREDNRAILAITAYPDGLFLIDPLHGIQRLQVPADISLSEVGISSSRSVWFNVRNKNDIARLENGAFIRVPVAPVPITPDVARVGEAFFSVKQSRGPNALLGTFQQSTGRDLGDSLEAVSDGAGGAWILDCFRNVVTHAGAQAQSRTFDGIGCPTMGIADDSGGVWFVAGRPGQLWHITHENASTSYALPIETEEIGNLCLDVRGEVWFPDRGRNRLRYFSKGRFGQVDLGNPGATPHLTIVQ